MKKKPTTSIVIYRKREGEKESREKKKNVDKKYTQGYISFPLFPSITGSSRRDGDGEKKRSRNNVIFHAYALDERRYQKNTL